MADVASGSEDTWFFQTPSFPPTTSPIPLPTTTSPFLPIRRANEESYIGKIYFKIFILIFIYMINFIMEIFKI